MKLKTALTTLIFLSFSFLLLNQTSLAQAPGDPYEISSKNVIVNTTVNVDLYSTVALNPAMVEITNWSQVSIQLLEPSGTPKEGRDTVIYVNGVSTGVNIVQPTLSDSGGNAYGSITSSNVGSYIVCVRDITEGFDIIIQQCQTLVVTAVPAPTINIEPQYTPGSTNSVSWSTGGTGPYQYYVEVSTTPDFSNIVSNSGWVSSTTHTASNLNDGQTYYYRVKARNNGGGESSWSNTVSSTQDNAGPIITLVDVTDIPPTTLTNSFDPDSTVEISYNITDINGVASKELFVVLLNGTMVSIPYTESESGNSWSVTVKLGDLPKDSNGSLYPAYSFFVKAIDNFGNESGNGSASISIKEPENVTPPQEPKPPSNPEGPGGALPPTTPGIPVVTTPSDNTTPDWTWVPSYDKETGEVVNYYTVQWCQNPTFVGCDSNVATTDTNSFTHTKPISIGKWFFRVRSKSDVGLWSDWSGTAQITVTSPHTEPSIPVVEDKNFWDIVKEVLKDTEDLVDTILESTIGKLTPSTVQTITVGAVLTNLTLGMSLILNLLGSVPYFLMQASLALLSLLGFRKKGNLSGLIYDSISKEGISQAIVRIYNDKGELIWTDVTDSAGRFKVIEVENGRYYIQVAANGYSFPSRVIIGSTDFPLDNVYIGGFFEVTNRIIPKFSIPLDKVEATKTEILSEMLLSRTKSIWKSLHIFLFIIGLIFSLYALKINPVWWNYFILALYIPSLVMLLIILFSKDEKYGIVRDEEGNRIEGFTVTLLDSDFDRVVATRVTDDKGRYRFLVDSGLYTISVLNMNYSLVNSEKYKGIKIKSKDTTVLCPDLVVSKKV